MNIPNFFKVNSKKFLLVIVLLFQFCIKLNENSVCNLKPISAYDSPKQQLITRNGLDRAVLLETDPDGDGIINDYVWINAYSTKKEEFLILFNEIQTNNNKPIEQIWFGPKNHKIIAKIDLNEDGNLESTIYYNFKAAPKIVSGIIARIEVDSNLDGMIDIWIYPNLRVEIDRKFIGYPNEFTENLDDIKKIFNYIKSDQKFTKKLNLLPKEKSYVVHPELITRTENIAVVPIGY